TKTAVTKATISVAWSAATDNVGVTGYDLYRGSVPTGKTAGLNATFSGLACGKRYTLGVDAYDAAGNKSAGSSLTVKTAGCSTTTPSGDTQAPSAPSGLAASSATQSAVVLTWSASTDNVGVAGYGVYRNGTSAGNTSATSYTVSGLACGISYTFAVDAYDAAGNRSAQTPLTASTTACAAGDTQAPTAPANLQKTATSESTVAV